MKIMEYLTMPLMLLMTAFSLFIYITIHLRLRRYSNLKKSTYWEGDALVAIFRKGNFLSNPTLVKLSEVFKYFFDSEDTVRVLNLRLHEGLFLQKIMMHGESLCALTKTNEIPSDFTEHGVLILVYDNGFSESISHHWNIQYNPKESTITDKRAVVYNKCPLGIFDGMLAVRAGPGVTLRFEHHIKNYRVQNNIEGIIHRTKNR